MKLRLRLKKKGWMAGLLGMWGALTACPAAQMLSQEDFARQREAMVETQLKARGIKDERVLKAMLKVPRHEFVPVPLRKYAYGDHPLDIGEGQTISQPYIVAFMTEALNPRPDHRVLEIGTGSGYQAAILAELVREVYTIEIIPSLAKRAEATLKRLGYTNVKVKIGDGYRGWKEYAPFDGILVTCAPDHVPQPLVEQLKEGGHMVIPVGRGFAQELYVLEKKGGKVIRKAVLPVLFVPMRGEAEKTREAGEKP